MRVYKGVRSLYFISMPDVLGYDARTIKSKLVQNVLAGIGGAALNSIQNLGWSHFNRNSMPPLSKRRFAPYRKRWGKRRGRRPFRARPGKKIVAFTGRSSATRRRYNRAARRVNSNMTRNDYDSTRDRIFKSYITGTAVGPVWTQHNFRVTDLTIASTKYLDYDHYKFSNIQCVITPKWQDSTAKLRTAGEADPYLYVLPRVHPDTISSTPTIQLLKTTPGVLRFNLRRSKPIVINMGAYLPRKQEYVGDQLGTVYNVEQPFFFPGFIHNPDSSTSVPANHPKFGSLYTYMPQLEATSDYIPNFTLEYYVTTYFRGNRALIDV